MGVNLSRPTMKTSSWWLHNAFITGCHDECMGMMRRAMMILALLGVPVLLALGGDLVSAPAGVPEVDTQPVQLNSRPGSAPAPALEPTPAAAPFGHSAAFKTARHVVCEAATCEADTSTSVTSNTCTTGAAAPCPSGPGARGASGHH